MMGSQDVAIPLFVDKVVAFEDGTSFELLEPLTDFMSCHDGHPQEARIVFTCKQVGRNQEGETYVMKVKVQEINQSSVSKNQAAEGPSSTTKAEVEALKRLKDNPYTPYLLHWKRTVQDENGPLPGGYITYMVMNKIPGKTLFDYGYREMLRDNAEETARKRQVISKAFLEALRSVHAEGIQPIDRGLRNIIWDEQKQKCGIIDFELWREPTGEVEEDEEELMRWGLVERPPPLGREHAWAMQWR